MTISSDLRSLQWISDQVPPWHLHVPIYQRLYVWGKDQLVTLLDDIVNAHDRDRTAFFYLGGLLVVKSHDDESGVHFDLIDGQQRITTLWMLAHVWGGAMTPFVAVGNGTQREPRLRFSIREDVQRMMASLVSGSPHAAPATDESNAGIQRMREAMATMQSALAMRAQDLEHGETPAQRQASLADYVFKKVRFIVTEVPAKTDLNKLFEVINNRGVQLQHHEILKARLLDALPDGERAVAAVMWDACADMDTYIERALAGASGMRAHEFPALFRNGDMGDAAAIRRRLSTAQGGVAAGARQAQRLEEILAAGAHEEAGDDAGGKEDPHAGRVRSIIGFPLLLQHALRIWLHGQRLEDLPRVLDRELLVLFSARFPGLDEVEDDAYRAQAVRSFLDLLWRVRVLFDEHVIKWVDQGDHEVHLIAAISMSSSGNHEYIHRSRDADSSRGLSLLQSMLYHSQEITTHYWLTPFLAHLCAHAHDEPADHLVYLQHLDNHLLGSAADDRLSKRSWSFMSSPIQSRAQIHTHELQQDDKGVGFAHYWFYKLEYVLWDEKSRARDPQDALWTDYRFTAKNSVEHISPQTPTERDLAIDQERVVAQMNGFGNLALVSRGINSEFGNLPFSEKRARYLNERRSGSRAARRDRVDSLKMDIIYDHIHWNDTLASAHRDDMITRFDRYVQRCDAATAERAARWTDDAAP